MENESSKILSVAKVFATVGVCFSKIDKDFHVEEKKFIETFVSDLLDNRLIEETSINEIKQIEDQDVTFEAMMSSVNGLYKTLDPVEKEVYEKNLNKFIIEAIAKDGKIADEEVALYDKFKKHFGK